MSPTQQFYRLYWQNPPLPNIATTCSTTLTGATQLYLPQRPTDTNSTSSNTLQSPPTIPP